MNFTINETSRSDPGFVADGYESAIADIEAEFRPEIEQKYADEWNASGVC